MSMHSDVVVRDDRHQNPSGPTFWNRYSWPGTHPWLPDCFPSLTGLVICSLVLILPGQSLATFLAKMAFERADALSSWRLFNLVVVIGMTPVLWSAACTSPVTRSDVVNVVGGAFRPNPVM